MAVDTTTANSQTQKRGTPQQFPPKGQLQPVDDLVEYVTMYARENPGTAALWCFGVGFIVGWKLKPW